MTVISRLSGRGGESRGKDFHENKTDKNTEVQRQVSQQMQAVRPSARLYQKIWRV